MPAPAVGSAGDARPSETPKDLKKRVRGLDKSLTSVHERLVQTEKQIFDLERSYLEETRLYGNVLQGWDAYLDTKGEGKGNGEAAGSSGNRGSQRETSEEEGVFMCERPFAGRRSAAGEETARLHLNIVGTILGVWVCGVRCVACIPPGAYAAPVE